MPDQKSSSLDLLGVKPVAESVNSLTNAAIDGAAAFLSRICLPAAEEVGLLLRDRVRAWRAANIAAMAEKAERKLGEHSVTPDVHAHPRMVIRILDHGSWTDDDLVQDMWAGLLVSACCVGGDDDSNLVFVNKLAELTKMQARILDYSCRSVRKILTDGGLVTTDSDLVVDFGTLQEISGERDLQRLDRELDYLRTLGLIERGFHVGDSSEADLTPTPFALHMFARCQGSRKSPIEFYELAASPDGDEPVA